MKRKKDFKSIERQSSTFFSYIYEKIGLYSMLEKIKEWMINNKKSSFFILVGSLIGLGIITFMRSSLDSKEVHKIAKQISTSPPDFLFQNNKQDFNIKSITELFKLTDSLEYLSNKPNLSLKDSLDFIRIYNTYDSIAKIYELKNEK